MLDGILVIYAIKLVKSTSCNYPFQLDRHTYILVFLADIYTTKTKAGERHF